MDHRVCLSEKNRQGGFSKIWTRENRYGTESYRMFDSPSAIKNRRILLLSSFHEISAGVNLVSHPSSFHFQFENHQTLRLLRQSIYYTRFEQTMLYITLPDHPQMFLCSQSTLSKHKNSQTCSVFAVLHCQHCRSDLSEHHTGHERK